MCNLILFYYRYIYSELYFLNEEVFNCYNNFFIFIIGIFYFYLLLDIYLLCLE